MEFHIETDRLILRELRESDAADFFEMDSNPDVHRYLGNKPITSMEQALAPIHAIRQQYDDNGIGRWATIEKSSGKFTGWSGLKFIKEDNGRTNFHDVGYRFMPQYWGKGYATESALAALQYGFEILNLETIIGTAHEENIASRKALERCGLKFVEQFMWNDIKCDWLEITKADWERKNSKQQQYP